MSFTKFLRDDPLLTREQVMTMLIQVANELDMPDKRAACVIAGMTIAVEVGVEDNDPPFERRFWCPANHRNPESFAFPHDSEADDNRSVGYFQQQKGPNGELWWGSTESMMRLHSAAQQFMSRLKKLNYHANSAQAAGVFAQTVQQSAHPDRYAKWHDNALRLFNKVYDQVIEDIPNPQAPQTLPPPHHLGDPVWLKDVLAWGGVSVSELEGAQNRGHGDFGKIWGIIIHHTGGNNSPVSEIAFHPQLGLCSQLHLAKNGHVTVCGVGVAYHAGYGSYPGLPEDAANGVTIGIECVNLPPQNGSHRQGWSDVQYEAMVKTCAAILVKLGHNSDRLISHKEWGGRKQGKWDPGSIDMNIMRADVQRRIDELRSGVGEDDMANVPQEQWDAVYRELTQKHPSRSIYRTPGEGKIDTMAGFGLNVDAMAHMELVERLAVEYGDNDAIGRVVRAARGEGADTSEWVRKHATEVVKRIPAEELQEWLDQN